MKNLKRIFFQTGMCICFAINLIAQQKDGNVVSVNISAMKAPKVVTGYYNILSMPIDTFRLLDKDKYVFQYFVNDNV